MNNLITKIKESRNIMTLFLFTQRQRAMREHLCSHMATDKFGNQHFWAEGY